MLVYRIALHVNFFFVAALVHIHTLAQPNAGVKWNFKSELTSSNEATVFMTAQLEPGWHIYSQRMEEGGPLPTHFSYQESNEYTLLGKTEERGSPVVFYDEGYEMDVCWYGGTVQYKQKVKLNHTKALLKGEVEYMACNMMVCIPGRQSFVVSLLP